MALICCFAFCSCEEYGGKKNESDNEATNETLQNLKGHWELIEKRVEPNRDSISESSKTTYDLTQTSHTLDYTYQDEPDVMNGEFFQGNML